MADWSDPLVVVTALADLLYLGALVATVRMARQSDRRAAETEARTAEIARAAEKQAAAAAIQSVLMGGALLHALYKDPELRESAKRFVEGLTSDPATKAAIEKVLAQLAARENTSRKST